MAGAYADAGADLIELGVPFSDPLADGPMIHAADTAALAAGATLESVLETCAAVARPASRWCSWSTRTWSWQRACEEFARLARKRERPA